MNVDDNANGNADYESNENSINSQSSESFHPDEANDFFHFEHDLPLQHPNNRRNSNILSNNNNNNSSNTAAVPDRRAAFARDTSLRQSQVFAGSFRVQQQEQQQRQMGRRNSRRESRRSLYGSSRRFGASGRNLGRGQQQQGRRASLAGSIADFRSSVVDFALDAKDAIQDEVLDIKDAFQDELEQADNGAAHFMQMSMTRTLALPPQQAQNVVLRFQQVFGGDRDNDNDDGTGTDNDDRDGNRTNGLFNGNGMGTPLLMTGSTDEEDNNAQQGDSPGVPMPANNDGDRPWYAYLLLVSAVVALSSVGPVSRLVSGAVPCIAGLWKLLGTSMVLLPMAIRVWLLQRQEHANDRQRQQQLLWRGGEDDDEDDDQSGTWSLIGWSWASWLTATIGAVSYATIGLAFGFAMKHTSIGNVLIFANSQSILLFLGKLMYSGCGCGDGSTTSSDPRNGSSSLSFTEGLGLMVTVAGALLCSHDSDRQRVEQLHGGNDAYRFQTLKGDALALLAGFAGVVYLVSTNALRDKVDILIYMPLNMLAGSAFVVGFITIVLHQHITIDLDPTSGVFGWMTPRFDRLAVELYIIFGCSVFGTFGYIQAMRYFDNLTVSFACLLEPMIATVVAFSCGVGLLPGIVGWVGNVLVVAGGLAIIYPSISAADNNLQNNNNSNSNNVINDGKE